MRAGLVGVSCAAVAALTLTGCAVPSARENFSATATLVAPQAPQALTWNLDVAADRDAQLVIGQLRGDGITASDAVAIAFLANPEVQLTLEKLEISRAELVNATTPPNPVAIVGVREPGGRLASFYPRNNISVGVLQNVLALLNGPARRRVARMELERVRAEVAYALVGIAAQVQEAYVECVAAAQVLALRDESVVLARRGIDAMQRAGSSPLDVALARNAVFSTEQSAARARLDLRTARSRLAQRMGIIEGPDDWQLAQRLPNLPASDPQLAELERLAPQRRLDLLGARHTLEARLVTLRGQRRWRWLGGIELGVFGERAADGTSFIGPNAVVELPLLDQRQAKLLVNDSETRSALRNLQLMTQAARADIRVHAAELAATRELTQIYRDEVLPNHAGIRERLAGEAAASALDHVRVAQGELGAREEEVGLLRDYWRARSALANASGDWGAAMGWPTGW